MRVLLTGDSIIARQEGKMNRILIGICVNFCRRLK